MLRSIKLLSVLCALALASPVFAGTSSGTIASSVTLGSDCSLTVTAMSFGTTSALLPASVNASSPLQVSCTSGTPYTIAIGQSTSTSGTSIGGFGGSNHLMSSNGFGVSGRPLYLPYNLNQDAAGAQPWGYTTGTDTVSGTGTGQVSNLTIYGKLSSGTTGDLAGRSSALIPGNYIDTVTITLSY